MCDTVVGGQSELFLAFFLNDSGWNQTCLCLITHQARGEPWQNEHTLAVLFFTPELQ